MEPAYCWSSILSNGCKMSECKRKERIVDKEPGRLKISLACVLNLFSSFLYLCLVFLSALTCLVLELLLVLCCHFHVALPQPLHS